VWIFWKIALIQVKKLKDKKIAKTFIDFCFLLILSPGEGSCASAPFRALAVKWPLGCPANAACCSEYGYCRPESEWRAGNFRDCNGVSNGLPLAAEALEAESAAAAAGDLAAANILVLAAGASTTTGAAALAVGPPAQQLLFRAAAPLSVVDAASTGFAAGVTLNGAGLNEAIVNGAALNGFASNGAILNGAGLNGAVVNGAAFNAAALNGFASNGAILNGAGLNGAVVNGAAFNGFAANGAILNGAALNGAILNGAAINSDGSITYNGVAASDAGYVSSLAAGNGYYAAGNGYRSVYPSAATPLVAADGSYHF